MPRQPKQSAKSTAGSESPSQRSSGGVLRLLYRPKVLFVAAIIGAGVLLLPYASAWLPDLSGRAEYRYSMSEMRVTPANRWVPPDLVQQVIDTASLPEEFSVLEAGIVEQVAGALGEHPWIARVVEVRLTREEGVEADLEYRIPVLMVETQRGVYAVDRESILLPPADFAIADVHRFPLLRNVKSTPGGDAGELWGDVVVLGGARLAAELAPEQDLTAYWDRFDLATIDAPAALSADVTLEELTYELVTKGGSRIVWGRPPGADHLEPTVEQKLGRLDDYFANHGSFESPRGPNRIDIRQFDAIEVITLQSEPRPRRR